MPKFRPVRMGEYSLMIKRSPSTKQNMCQLIRERQPSRPTDSPGRCPKRATSRPGQKTLASPLNRTLVINPGTHGRSFPGCVESRIFRPKSASFHAPCTQSAQGTDLQDSRSSKNLHAIVLYGYCHNGQNLVNPEKGHCRRGLANLRTELSTEIVDSRDPSELRPERARGG